MGVDSHGLAILAVLVSLLPSALSQGSILPNTLPFRIFAALEEDLPKSQEAQKAAHGEPIGFERFSQFHANMNMKLLDFSPKSSTVLHVQTGEELQGRHGWLHQFDLRRRWLPNATGLLEEERRE